MLHFDAEFSYTSVVTTKCDVYSFGVLVLEIVMGRYPRELQSIAFMEQHQELAIEDMLDQRLSSPTVVEKEEIALLVEVAFSCLQTSPQSRPPMKESALGSRDQLQEASREQTLELDLPQAPGRLLDRALAGLRVGWPERACSAARGGEQDGGEPGRDRAPSRLGRR